MEKSNKANQNNWITVRLSFRPGLSYVEVLLASVILAVLIASAVQLFGNLARSQSTAADQDGAEFLALEMTREIVRRYYKDPDINRVIGVEADEIGPNRGRWDDIDDYHKWSSCPPMDRWSTPYNNLAHLTRSVNVQNVAANDFTQTVADDQGFRAVTITVNDGPKILVQHTFVIPDIIPPYYVTR
ncbi:MAG: hypothetical protein GY869_17025 [Planctomycetes bacterium]|nr:hypothetical protein [Planctomycetota bacterium]